jgi:hypothetical protein
LGLEQEGKSETPALPILPCTPLVLPSYFPYSLVVTNTCFVLPRTSKKFWSTGVWLFPLGLESIQQLVCIQLLILNLDKLFSEAEKKNEVKDFAHFEKVVFFSIEKRHVRSTSYFSTGRKHLLRLKRRFSWSAASALSNHVKQAKKILLEAWIVWILHYFNCKFLYSKLFFIFIGGRLYRVNKILLYYRYHPEAATFSVHE